MADDEDVELDPAIAEAMGFSGFGAQPGKKRKLNSTVAITGGNSQPLGKQGNRKTHTGPPGDAITSLNPKIRSVSADVAQVGSADSTMQDSGSMGQPAMAANTNDNDKDSLRALASGVRNESGDMVYFLPSFIEDPWARLKSR